jgi:hypothetical protein
VDKGVDYSPFLTGGRGVLIEFLSNAQISDLSGRFDYPTGPQTTGAYLDIFHLTILHRPHPTEVGEPTPFGSVIGVRDIIADLRTLAADITEFSHGKRLLGV